MTYDSRIDTYEHIRLVANELHRAAGNLLARSLAHDASKLQGVERDCFDEITPLLKDTEYGSDEYKATLNRMRPAIEEHYRNNPHHPEHYTNGIDGMSLFDLIEMLCDWNAARQRHDPPKSLLAESLDYNIERFGIGEQLASILRSTIRQMGYAVPDNQEGE